jgi:hypothetical protein
MNTDIPAFVIGMVIGNLLMGKGGSDNATMLVIAGLYLVISAIVSAVRKGIA